MKVFDVRLKNIKKVIGRILAVGGIVCLSFCYCFYSYDVPAIISARMIKENYDYIQIERYLIDDDSNRFFGRTLAILSEDDINVINSKVKNGYNIYRFMDRGVSKNINDLIKINWDILQNSNAYIFKNADVDIVRVDSFDLFFSEEVVGEYPKSGDEILITNHFADLIIERGMKILDRKGNEKDYKPESYNELVEDGKYFFFGDKKVKIAGIIKYDLTEYTSLRDKTWEQLNEEEDELALKLIRESRIIYNKIYVTEEFTSEHLSQTGVLVLVSDKEMITNILQEFRYDDELVAMSAFHKDIYVVIDFVNIFERITLVVGLVMIAFSLVIYMFDFSNNDFYRNLKNVGVLYSFSLVGFFAVHYFLLETTFKTMRMLSPFVFMKDDFFKICGIMMALTLCFAGCVKGLVYLRDGIVRKPVLDE